MEHAEPLERSFSRRTATLSAGLLLALALTTIGGVVLYQRIDRTHPAAARSASTRPAVDTRHSPTKQAPAAPLRPRARVPVLVLNGNGIAGAAGAEVSRLHGRGYRRTDAANATIGYATSLVLFRPGWAGEAKRLAHDAGIRTVAPLDGSLPSIDSGYRVIVILGASS